jgi:DNA-binding NarL/FixJ family response regulator
MKVLIVEDNRQMRQMIRRVLDGVADEITECCDGETASSLYNDARPDWVLMDIEMGEVNGLVATHCIKASFPDARIVVVTNSDDDRLREAAKAAGACGYVLKEDLTALKLILSSPP